MYSSQPSSAQVVDAIQALSGSDRERSSQAHNLLKTINGTDLSLLPVLVEALVSRGHQDVVVGCALALSRYGDKAQAHIETIAGLLIPECQLEPVAATAVIYLVSAIQCTRSVQVFKDLLKSQDQIVLLSAIESFGSLGELARELVPELREIEKRGEMLGATARHELKEFYAKNTGLEFEDLLNRRAEFTAVELHFGASHFAPEPHQLRELDLTKEGLLHDEMFDFCYGNASGMCRLRIGRDREGEVAVMFSYDRRSSGVSIQNVIEHLASTVRQIFPELPESPSWYEHWCPSSGVVSEMELTKVEFEYQPLFDYLNKPQWRKVDAPEIALARYGFDLSEFNTH